MYNCISTLFADERNGEFLSRTERSILNFRASKRHIFRKMTESEEQQASGKRLLLPAMRAKKPYVLPLPFANPLDPTAL